MDLTLRPRPQSDMALLWGPWLDMGLILRRALWPLGPRDWSLPARAPVHPPHWLGCGGRGGGAARVMPPAANRAVES